MSRVGNRENGKNDPLHTLKDRSFAMVLIFGLVIVVLAVLWLVMSDQDGKQDDLANEHFRESGPKERSTDRNDPSNSEESPDAKESAAAVRDRVAVKGADDERISLVAPQKGVIVLTVRDRDTGAPVQDLRFVAFSEQKRCFLAEGRTRADGRARIEGLPDGTVVIFTERKPPHAQGFRALWIEGGAKIETVLEVGRGGHAVGRLIDDQGEPLEGYLLRVQRSPAVPSYAGKAGRGLETAAVSSRDGRFEVTHLAASPRWIWIIEGEERPESWESCKIALCTPDHPDEPIWTCHLDLTAEEVQDLGDIVIERGMNYGGRILEADGRPVMGALIRANDRFIIQALYGWPIPSFGELKNPWQEGYDLPPDGDLTDENGRFSIRLSGRTSRGFSRNLKVLVWTRDGRRETFELPETEPGGSILDLEYRLRDDYLIEIALLDAAGMPTKPWGKDGPPEGLDRIGRHNISMWPDTVILNVSFQGETASWKTERVPDPDGKVCLQIDPARGVPAGLHVTVPGYKTVRDVLPPDPPRRLERQYRLEPLPRIRLQATLTGALDTLDPFHDLIVIQACLLSPERKSRLDDLERLMYCCGLGARSDFKVDAGLERIIMPVRSQEPFWIYARLVRKTERHSRKWESVPAQAFGPFEPSETLRSIRLHVTPKTVAEGPAGKSPPASGAGQDVGSGRLSIRPSCCNAWGSLCLHISK